MADQAPKVIIIPAKQPVQEKEAQRQLRVAAYCRVSTDDEEQLTSYEAQKTYYTDLIMQNKNWTMAGIFADEGITGTSTKKRDDFRRMIKMCRQKKIDLILTKSISRFARNTVDCLNYVRALRELNIAVIFEKENINTMSAESELFITLLSAFAQAESESISANVKWGKRQAMRLGKTIIMYKTLYGYEKGEDGRPKIIPEQAKIVYEVYRRYLGGDSLRMIQNWLDSEGITNKRGNPWTPCAIHNLLTNEKYCGDVLLQKTFIDDCISRRVIKNTGQLPMYLIQNHHEPIIERKMFDAAQREVARRNAVKSPSKRKAPTGKANYASKYALSERLVCGECGTRYRRCTWLRNGEKRIVWRCVSRLDYGHKYCRKSPTMDEGRLQEAILAAINSTMGDKKEIIREVVGAMEMELAAVPGETMSLSDIEHRLETINKEVKALIMKAAQDGDSDSIQTKLKELLDETTALKNKRTYITEQRENDAATTWKIENAAAAMAQMSADITWDESLIRQLVETVRVVDKNKIIVYMYGGAVIEQAVAE